MGQCAELIDGPLHAGCLAKAEHAEPLSPHYACSTELLGSPLQAGNLVRGCTSETAQASVAAAQ